MSTRYLSRRALLALLERSGDPLAQQAHAALNPEDAELLSVSSGAFDIATYEVRLARAEAGDGPTVRGLRVLVEALRGPLEAPETTGFRGGDDRHYVLLLDGGHVRAIASVEGT